MPTRLHRRIHPTSRRTIGSRAGLHDLLKSDLVSIFIARDGNLFPPAASDEKPERRPKGGGIVTAAEPLSVEHSPELSDEDVLHAVRGGNASLYELLMRRHNQTLYRAVRAILRDESEIEDVLQETYLAAYRNLSAFEGRSRVSTWLVQIAVNKALDLRRRRSRSVTLDPELDARHAEVAPAFGAPEVENPERGSARRELARALEGAVDALPESFREVYVLRDVEGWSTEETAEGLGLAAATVRTRLHRARVALRERLAGDFDAASLSAFPFGAERCDRVVAVVLGKIEQSLR